MTHCAPGDPTKISLFIQLLNITLFLAYKQFHFSELGRLFLKNNIGLIYGAGDKGIMGKIAQVISEGGGKVTGIIPDFFLEDGISGTGPGETVIIDSMHKRKQYMCDNVSQ